MQNRKTPPTADAEINPLEDDGIIEFAEEILGTDGDDIVGPDKIESADGEDDEIIDLTDLADMPPEEEDDILDLTEDVRLPAENGDDVFELEEVAEEILDGEEVIVEMDDEIEDLTIPDDAILDLDDVADEIADAEENMVELEDVVDQDRREDQSRITDEPDFMDEDDTIELSAADRSALEAEFGYEPTAEDLAGVADAPDEGRDTGQGEEILLDFDDLSSPDAAREADSDVLAAKKGSAKESGLQAPQQKLELSETDRRILEEELDLGMVEAEPSVSGDDNAPGITPDKRVAALTEEDLAADDTIALYHDESGSLSFGEPDSHTADADLLPLEEDPVEARTRPGNEAVEDFRLDFDDQGSEESVLQEEPSAENNTKETESVAPHDQPDASPAEQSFPEERDSADPFSFEFDDVSEKQSSAAADADAVPLTDEEELSVAALLADAVATNDEAPQGDSAEPDRASGNDTDSVEGFSENAFLEKGDHDRELKMDFDQTEDAPRQDLHRMADPIMIRVKEPATENHADEDALLNKVFEPEPDNIAPERLEEVVEQAVNRIFSQKIESILVEAIEKAVTKEIEHLKSLILGDLDRRH